MQTFCNICSDFHMEKTEHRSLLSFLWWENGDISEEPQDYHMNVHIFGVTSSPSFINYTLWRTANDHQARYDKEAADMLRKTFYIDDLVKSVQDEQTAIKLVKE